MKTLLSVVVAVAALVMFAGVSEAALTYVDIYNQADFNTYCNWSNWARSDVVVTFHAGTYDAYITPYAWNFYLAGPASNVTIQADTTNGPVIMTTSAPAPAAPWFVIQTWSNTNLTIDGLTVNTNPARVGIQISGSVDSTLKNNTFNVPGGAHPYDCMIQAEANTNLTIDNNTQWGGVHGVRASWRGAMANSTISNNNITATLGNGIELGNAPRNRRGFDFVKIFYITAIGVPGPVAHLAIQTV